MLTQLSTVKSRLALTVTDYDDLLTSAIKAVSDRFDKECNRNLARTTAATHEFDAASASPLSTINHQLPGRHTRGALPSVQMTPAKIEMLRWTLDFGLWTSDFRLLRHGFAN